MAACHWRSSVANDASGEPGETPEYPALPTHAGLCVGGPCSSLATRGTTMDSELKSNVENELGNREGSRDGSPREGARTVKVSPPAKKNRCGAERRRAKRMRAAALEGARSLGSPCTPVEVVKGHADGKRRKGSKDTPPSGGRPLKRQRTRDGQHAYSDAADPLARVIVAEGYPETEITAEQLTLLRGAVSKEIDGIQEGPVPRFHGTSLRSGAAVVRCADEASLDWLVGRIGGIIPWEGARLKVMGLDALQKQHRAVVWILGPPEGAATVLKRLEKQNPGLVTGSWKVFAEG
ncbi:uncharacterized protein [Linepithema humile]|uniref:uncharacterized protein n=1 Tax=Linepithema humile TaxID=83485 RepID=UPI00351F10D6